MSTQQIPDGKAPVTDPRSPSSDESVRALAVKQLEQKRHFRMHAVLSATACIGLLIIWAITEYSNAGGWPTEGFSQSGGTPHVWNIWIIYPVVGLGLILAVRAWFTYRKPITESEIRREMDHLSGTR
jgi:2TM domain